MNNKASFIEIVTAVFAAGESRLFALTGQYFEIIDATFPVDVTLSDVYGAQRGLMKSAEASFNLKGTDFGVIQITSASAQTIRFAYGTGEAGTRRAAGAVSIVGTVPVDLVANSLNSLSRPLLPAVNYTVSGALLANTAVSVFLAAANTNGAIIHAAAANDTQATVGVLALLAKSTAPANVADGDVIAQASVYPGSSSNYLTLELKQPTRIAAGLGLWFIGSVNGLTPSLRSVRYTLL